MVRPKSKKSASRRSSILKASVVHTPVQHVQSNVSLYQESPATTKHKRRVSFAEKKHVKEFCDSAERGTLWDTTYEESSNENTGQIELNNQFINLINNDDKSMDLTEPVNIMGSIKSDKTSKSKLLPTICQSTCNNEDINSISITSNPIIDICTDKNIIVYNDSLNSSEIDSAKLNKTCIQDISMEVTEIPHVMNTQNIVPMMHKQLLEGKENIPMSSIINRTNFQSILQNKKDNDNISSKIPHLCTQQLQFVELPQLQQIIPNRNQFANDYYMNNEKTQIFDNVPMEVTSVIPLISRTDLIDQTVIFHDKSMDDTSVVTSVINKKEIANNDLSKLKSNKTKLLDESMEVTNGIPFRFHAKQITDESHDKTKKIHDSMELTDTYHDLSKRKKVDANEFMANTVPIHVPDTLQCDNTRMNYPTTNLCRKNQDINASKTQIFHNESMAITAPIRAQDPSQYGNKKVNVLATNLCRKNQDINASKTQIFQNESMAITAPIYVLDSSQCGNEEVNDPATNLCRKNQDINASKTQIFHNESMAITAPIHVQDSSHFDNKEVNDPATNLCRINQDINASKTQIFQNESMAITAPIHVQDSSQCGNKEVNDPATNLYRINEDINASKTQIFQNESMAITAPIKVKESSQCCNKEVNDPAENLCRKNQDINASKTRIFQNESMAITAPIHVLDSSQCGNKEVNDPAENLCGINQDINASKTQIFQNESMAITAPIHVQDSSQFDNKEVNVPAANLCRKNQNISASKTQIFQNESMAITAPIHVPDSSQCGNKEVNDPATNLCRINQDINASKTQIFQNESMAITAPIHVSDTLQCEIKEVNGGTNLCRVDQDINSSKTQIFQNQSMAVTASIHVPVSSECGYRKEMNSSTTLLRNGVDPISCNQQILADQKVLPETADNDNSTLNIIENEYDEVVNNRSANETLNDTLNSSVTSNTEYIHNHSVKALTSLISSFVYADMMEDDSFAVVNENELQSMESAIAQQTNDQQNNSDIKSMLNKFNEEDIQSLDNCMNKSEDIIREHVNCSESHHDSRNNNVILDSTENNHCDISDIVTEINKKKKDIERKSETYVIKPKKTSYMNQNEYTDCNNTNNQISHTVVPLSSILPLDSDKNKMYIAESNLVPDLPGNINFHNSNLTENHNTNSSNKEIKRGTLSEKLEESEKGTFSLLVQQLRTYMDSNDCIWDLYVEDIRKQMLVISFINKSLLIVIFTQNDIATATSEIKHIDIISRVENNDNILLSIAHKLIKEKISRENLNQVFKYDEDIIPLLNYVSDNVKSVLDFIFDLRKLDDTNLMEIDTERIIFTIRSKFTNIILKVTMNVKSLDKIDSSDINIVCILGTIRTEDIKELIINIKRDHTFLRKYISDIRDYIDIIEQTDLPIHGL